MLSRNDTITLGQQVGAFSIQPLRYCHLYNGLQILDTELRQTKTLKFVVEYRKDITQEVHA